MICEERFERQAEELRGLKRRVEKLETAQRVEAGRKAPQSASRDGERWSTLEREVTSDGLTDLCIDLSIKFGRTVTAIRYEILHQLEERIYGSRRK